MRIDHTHRKWAIATAGLLGVSAAAYIPYALTAPNGPSGSSVLGLTFGIAGFAIMVFASLLGLRKKFPVWRIGRAQTWMRGHLWLGLLSYFLILFHAGFDFGGPLTRVMMWTFTVVIVSGVAGAALQHYMPRFLTSEVPTETIYDQIDRVRGQLIEEAGRLLEQVNVPVAQAAGAAGGAAVAVSVRSEQQALSHLRSFYADSMCPYLETRGGSQHVLGAHGGIPSAFQQLRTLTPPGFHGLLDDLESICQEKFDLDRQSRLHRILHGWLLVHVPLSLALMVLAAAHAVMALRY